MPKLTVEGGPYRFVQDDSCHWYVIPIAKEKEWWEWREIPEDDERSWDVPEWALRTGGGPEVEGGWIPADPEKAELVE